MHELEILKIVEFILTILWVKLKPYSMQIILRHFPSNLEAHCTVVSLYQQNLL